MEPMRMAQYGTKHGHAAGKLSALQRNPDVEFAGIYEPDGARRRALQQDSRYEGIHWFSDAQEMLKDPSIVAVASEGRNDESLPQTEEIVRAGKHVWYDKPAGDDWARWQRVVELAREKELLIQMGYMFRYHEGFRRIAAWARSGLLGDIFAIRAHMSTNLTEEARRIIATHRGGIFYDLAGHMLDQIMWLLGRPIKVSRYLRHDDRMVPGFSDNTLVVFEWEEAMASEFHFYYPGEDPIAEAGVVEVATEPAPILELWNPYDD
jgi:predicted dehydrogenase